MRFLLMSSNVIKFIESSIMCGLLSLIEENLVKFKLYFYFEGEQTHILKYFITITKELRKKLGEETRIATGIIAIQIGRRIIVKENNKVLLSQRVNFPKAEILLRRTIDITPQSKEIDERSFLINVILSEAPKGSIPIYLLNIAYEKLSETFKLIQQDIQTLIKPSYELSQIMFKVSSKKTKSDILNILKLAFKQILTQSFDTDIIDFVLLEYKRFYGFEEKKFIGNFKNIYESAYKIALRSFLNYIDLINYMHNTRDIARKLLAINNSLDVLETQFSAISELSKRYLSESEYSKMKNLLDTLYKEVSKRKKRKRRYYSIKTKILKNLEISVVSELLSKLDKILDKLHGLNKQNQAKLLNSLFAYLIDTSELKDYEKLIIAMILILSSSLTIKEKIKFLKKLRTRIIASREIVSQLFDLTYKALVNPNEACLFESGILQKMLLYPLNVRDFLHQNIALKLCIPISFSIRLYLIKKVRPENLNDPDRAIKTYLNFCRNMKISKKIAISLLEGLEIV